MDKKLTPEQLEANLDKLKTNVAGKALRQVIDDNIDMLNNVESIRTDAGLQDTESVVLGRKMAMHLMRVLKKRITEDLAKEEKGAIVESEYE